MAKFILIENPGVASPESFTLLGASNKAGTAAIGQFGSGTKFGVLVCLRKRLDPVIFCGNLRLAFGTKNTTFEGQHQEQVTVKYSGKNEDGKSVSRTALLSIVLRYGEVDWKDNIQLALREFVSNALDAVQGRASQVTVAIVEGEPRAKAGTTRVYVPLTDDGQDFVTNLSEWFLHFATDKEWQVSAVLDKDAPSPARIYRRGVLVRKVDRQNSLFDYNLNDLPLDEARIANDYAVKKFAETALNQLPVPKILSRVLAADKAVWEASFDLTGRYDWDTPKVVKDQVTSAWQRAQERILDEKTIFAGEYDDISLAQGKGYKVIRLNQERYEIVVSRGLKTVANVLTVDEREGRQIDAVTNPRAELAVRMVWEILVSLDFTKGEKFPTVHSYTEHNTGNGSTFGLWKNDAVYINNCLLGGGEISPELFAVCLEELAHHITKATDNSRGFQEYFIQLLTKVLR